MKKAISRRDFLKTSSRLAAAAGVGSCGILLKGCSSKKDFDLILKRGRVYDGLGQKPFSADIGISGQTIKEIGRISSSRGKAVIDAKDLSVCPGFIDTHDHSDIGLLVNPRAESHIRQGITTLVSGNCGSSPFPVPEEIFEEQRENLREQFALELDWMDIKGFFSRLEEKGLACNYATFVGQGTIRGAAMGFNDRPPKPEELERMKLLVAENIKQGAIGLSSGLEYSPGSYAQPDEITELCRVVSQLGGMYASHMRDEGDFLLESLDETMDIAGRTGIRIQISHFKVAYPRNWHKINAALARLDEAKDKGIDLFCDRYPYTAGSTGLSFNFPLWARQGTTEEFLARLKDPSLENRLRAHILEREEKIGAWDKVVITDVVTEKNKGFEGRSVQEGAQETGKDPFEFMRDLLIEEKNRVGMVIFMMKEENLMKILAHPLVGIGCDGSAMAPYGLLSQGKPHPRSYGTFPRVLGKYIRDEKIMPFEAMIKKMTSAAAEHFGFTGRGTLRVDHKADLVIFDEEHVIDKATWKDPHQYPEGIIYVIVNGTAVVHEEEHTGRLPGQILKKQATA